MVCSPWVKRAVSGYIAVLLLFCGGMATNSDVAWAGSKGHASQAAGRLGITAVRLNSDGNGILFDADRPFSGNETRNFSVLRLPSPYRLLIDIPNAYLSTGQKVFPINQHGIDRVELSDNSSPFYSSVRAIIYVTNGHTLGQLNPVFEGNALKLEAGPSMAMRPDQLATTSFSTTKPPVSKAPVPEKTKVGQPIKPLPPVAKHMPALSSVKQPPIPPAQQPAEAEKPAVPQGSQTVLGTPAAPGVNIVEEVFLRDNHLNIRALPGAELRVKNRFTLTAPSRLVLDIENAVLSSRALMTPMSGGSEDLKQIRVGQFDENTVRIVIETAIPEQFEAVYSGGERNLLAISPYSSTSITKLSSNTKLGEVQSIDLKRDGGSTILRITASSPIVHRFFKKDDKVTLDLLNEASHPTAIGFDQKQYPEIAKMRLEPLTDGQPNSKLSIHLANSNMRVVPTVSDDGKVMELLIASEDPVKLNGLSNLLGLGAAGNAPFPARIVVDAGHGGKDIGANRSGVNEKDLNLSLALMVRDALTAKGFKVYMTRSTDVFLPLPQITAITNQIHPDLFISIHHNASVNPALKGIETYYFTPQSIPLAKRVHAREINSVGVRDGGVKKARFYVIHHTSVPAILCEVGYVSNPSELADGVVDYLKTRVSAKAKPR